MDRGGIETFIMNVYRNIDRNAIQFDFLVHTERECAYDKEITELGGKIYRVPPRNKGIFTNYQALKKFFHEHKEYLIVHQHVSSLTYITPLIVSKRFGVPVRIVHGHSTTQGGNKLNKYLHKLNRKYIKRVVTNRFACSKLSAKWTFGEVEEQIDIIKNGIDTAAFAYDKKVREYVRRKFGLNGKFVIGHIGRFNKVKNHSFLIKIFSEITKQKPSSVLILIGEGKEKKEIQKEAAELNIEDKVLFLSPTNNVKDFYQAMDVFVFPSLNEGLGIVLLEAQASGLVSYASKHRVPEEVNVTKNVNFIELEKGPYIWAKEIINSHKNRQSFIKQIDQKGYGIKEVSNYLQEFYSGRYRR
ncbi:glycosyltransferase family 1 protein [Terribacillus halophilus]|nr:glycosyltransferase family 1 protein [Terribacillus halophilus]